MRAAGRRRTASRWWVLVSGLLVASVVGHLYYWYAPRIRAAAGDPEDLPLLLLADDSADMRLWVPYPHQNLGHLAMAVDDPEEYLAAIARLADQPSPVLPRFGPLALPPAQELAAAYAVRDAGGGEFSVAARVYPAMTVIARLSGLLAGNPWLRGGDVRFASQPARVAWRGTLWSLRTEGARHGEGGGSVRPLDTAPRPAVLGAVGLSGGGGLLPAGIYVLEESAARSRVRLHRIADAWAEPAPDPTLLLEPEAILDDDVIAVALSGAGGSLGERPGALVLLRQGTDDGRIRLPSAAALSVPGGERWALPGEELGRLLGLELRRGRSAGWQIVSLDSRSLEAAKDLAPALSELLAQSDQELLRFGLWFHPSELLDLAGSLHRALDAVPLISRRRVQFWQDVTTALRPLGSARSVAFESTVIGAEGRGQEGSLARRVPGRVVVEIARPTP